MVYTDGILERINLNDSISADGYKVIDGTIGEWLENYNNHFLDLFISRANGGFLDLIGSEYGITRKTDESDKDFRHRIHIETTIIETTNDFLKLGVKLWTYNPNFIDRLDSNEPILISDNPYLKSNSYEKVFFAYTDDNTVKDYINNKFLLEDIEWL